MSGVESFHIVITGQVQGVFFRASMKRIADKYNVVGWVRNMGDGGVEATLQGQLSDIQKVIEWTRKGPPGAIVENLLISKTKGEESCREFAILRD